MTNQATRNCENRSGLDPDALYLQGLAATLRRLGWTEFNPCKLDAIAERLQDPVSEGASDRQPATGPTTLNPPGAELIPTSRDEVGPGSSPRPVAASSESTVIARYQVGIVNLPGFWMAECPKCGSTISVGRWVPVLGRHCGQSFRADA